MTEPNRITIHHTATASGPGPEVIDQIRRYHVKERGWSDIAYHVLIDEHGVMWLGRAFDKAPDSHSDYDFSGHLAVAVIGNYEDQKPEWWQTQTLFTVVELLARVYNIPADNIKGHRDYADTLCPGRYLYELLPQLREAVSTPDPAGDEGDE